MASSIYVTTAEAHCGKSLVCLGIIEHILRKTRRVSIFRPVVTSDSPNKKDKNIDLILSHFHLDLDYEETYAFSSREAQDLISRGHTDKVLDKIIEKYKSLEKKSDFILCEGSDFISESSSFEFSFNVQIAKNLSSPVLIIGKGDGDRSIEDTLRPLQLAIENFVENDCEVIGAIVNRAKSEDAHELLVAMQADLPIKTLFLSAIPENRLLKSPTVKEIRDHLNAKVLYGEELLDNQVFLFSIAAMQLHNYLEKITENSVVITPGDRGEIILSTITAHLSENYPKIAAILLTAGLMPEKSILRLLEGVTNIIPILLVEPNTFETAMNLKDIHSHVTPENQLKIEESLRIFERYVNVAGLEEKISKVEARGMTPRMFQFLLTQKAKEDKKHIVLPEGDDERVLKAAQFLTDQNIVKLTLLGDKDKITEQISRLGLNLDERKITILTPHAALEYENYVNIFYEIRKSKGVNLDVAHDLMNDVSYFGTMMVYQGHADGMVSGAVHTTQHTIRPALQFVKTKPGFSIVSSVFFMCLEDRVLVYGDCAINPNPNAEELAEIALSSSETAKVFGIEPKVAMLSYSSGQSGQGADVEIVKEATAIVKKKDPKLKVEGPIQYDAAVDFEVGTKKVPGSEVAGQATVLIFPDLNTGNNTYKAVQRETGAIAIGPVLQGLNKPVNDLSRGCTVTDIINTVIITSIQAQLD
ncbi:MAG: phosphate acetyltransferase [Bacteroidota bacterium]